MAIFSQNKCPAVKLEAFLAVMLNPVRNAVKGAPRSISAAEDQYKNIGLPNTLRTLGKYCSGSYSSSTSTRFKPLVIMLIGT